MAFCSAEAASPLWDELVMKGGFPQDDHKPSCPSRNCVWDAATAAARDSDGGQALAEQPFTLYSSLRLAMFAPNIPVPRYHSVFKLKNRNTNNNQTTKYLKCVGVAHQQFFTPQSVPGVVWMLTNATPDLFPTNLPG